MQLRINWKNVNKVSDDNPKNGDDKYPVRKDIADLLKEIDKSDGLPQDTREKLRTVLLGIVKIEETIISGYSFSGPVPSPEAISQYKKEYADAPRIIFEMANRESTTKEAYVKGNLRNDRLKIIGSFTGYFGVLGLSALAMFLDKPTVAVTLGISGAVVFLLRILQQFLE